MLELKYIMFNNFCKFKDNFSCKKAAASGGKEV